MIFKTQTISKLFKFSRSKSFDIVFVGPLAARLSHEIFKEHGQKFNCLNINAEPTHLEPTLFPFNTSPIPVSTIIPTQYQSYYSGISLITPENNLLTLSNNQKIYYNQLVFTSNNQPDYDRYQGLKDALNDQCSNVFVNNGSNLNNLKQLCLGNLIFSIPEGRHLGQDNYQFLSINDYIRKKLKNNKQKTFQIHPYLILQDTKIFKYNKQLDEFAKQQCRLNKIEIIENKKVVKVDTSNRRLLLSSGQYLPYSGYYQYLPLKNNLIQGETNHQTLRNEKYPNVFVFGNGQVPTTHSYGAKNYQLRVVKENVVNNLLGIKKQALYDGRTILPVLTSSNEAVYFTHSYNKKLRSFGNFKPWNIALAKMEELLGANQVSNYYKFNTYGYPYYLWNKKVKIVKTNNKIQSEIPLEYVLSKKIEI